MMHFLNDVCLGLLVAFALDALFRGRRQNAEWDSYQWRVWRRRHNRGNQ